MYPPISALAWPLASLHSKVKLKLKIDLKQIFGSNCVAEDYLLAIHDQESVLYVVSPFETFCVNFLLM